MAGQPWSELIETWFAKTLQDPASVGDRMAWWFGPNGKRDADLEKRFGGLVKKCGDGLQYDWLEHPEGRLAVIITLDQLPRNLFRGSPEAFTFDAYTAALCMAAALTGQDRELQPVQRAFLYMPLQHFEDLAGQETGVALYQQLADETPAWPIFQQGFLPYAKQHRDIIARFGRFPHRNKTLGRKNTPEEDIYLAAGAPTFGQ